MYVVCCHLIRILSRWRTMLRQRRVFFTTTTGEYEVGVPAVVLHVQIILIQDVSLISSSPSDELKLPSVFHEASCSTAPRTRAMREDIASKTTPGRRGLPLSTGKAPVGSGLQTPRPRADRQTSRAAPPPAAKSPGAGGANASGPAAHVVGSGASSSSAALDVWCVRWPLASAVTS